MPLANGITAAVNPCIEPFKCTALKSILSSVDKPFLTAKLPKAVQLQLEAFGEELKKLDTLFDKVRSTTNTNR